MSHIVETHFAPPGRASPSSLEQQIAAVGKHPATSVVLQSLGGVVVILNEERQIVAFNEGLLELMGVSQPKQALGLRAGEALRCVHVESGPNGCGTTKACRDCGAVLATLASQASPEPAVAECLMTRRVEAREEPLDFRARATPFRCDEQSFTILTLQDIQAEKRCETLSRIFLHEMRNVISGLHVSADLLVASSGDAELPSIIQKFAIRLAEETSLQADLMEAGAVSFKPACREATAAALLADLSESFRHAPLARDRLLEIERQQDPVDFMTDPQVVLRVLKSMVRNAFEAIPAGGSVRVSYEADADGVVFKVWNAGEIPEQVAMRIFQRHFTTKDGVGRGLGTYGMKLLGERCLGGEVEFSTSPADGTAFRLRLPLAPGGRSEARAR